MYVSDVWRAIDLWQSTGMSVMASESYELNAIDNFCCFELMVVLGRGKEKTKRWRGTRHSDLMSLDIETPLRSGQESQVNKRQESDNTFVASEMQNESFSLIYCSQPEC